MNAGCDARAAKPGSNLAMMAAVSLPILLAACASAPKVEVMQRGEPVQYVSGQTYAFAGGEDAPQVDPELSGVLEQRLSQLGLCRDASAAWRIEPIYVMRGENVGVAHDGNGAWIEPPRSPRFWRGDGEVRILTLRWIETASGAEHYGVTARLHGRQKDDERARQSLIDAVLPISDTQAASAPDCGPGL